MAERGSVRTLVLEVEGPPRTAARLLADRFPGVACARRELRFPIGSGETPEAVLACCRERGIGVSASRIRLRPAADADTARDAPASRIRGEVVR